MKTLRGSRTPPIFGACGLTEREKKGKIFVLRGYMDRIVEFSHSLDPERAFKIGVMNARQARGSGLRLDSQVGSTTEIVATRLVEHLERAEFGILNRPPIRVAAIRGLSAPTQ